MTLPRTPSFRLDGRRALVAGASSGIGRASAAALAEAGAAVTLVARRAGPLETIAAELAEAGFAAEILALDIVDLDAVAAALALRPAFDVVVNSAGVARHGPALTANADDFDTVIELNLRAAYFLAATTAGAMIAAGKPGSIITISSQMGHVGGIDRTLYSASKHAVEGMTKSMAIEWGHRGIRVNTIGPTFIRTPLTQSTFDNPDRRAWIEDKIKLGRIGEVEDVMGAVVYLASDASALVTGTALLVDGGWTAD